jgi:hypothetical protein
VTDTLTSRHVQPATAQGSVPPASALTVMLRVLLLAGSEVHGSVGGELTGTFAKAPGRRTRPSKWFAQEFATCQAIWISSFMEMERAELRYELPRATVPIVTATITMTSSISVAPRARRRALYLMGSPRRNR